MNVRGLRHQAQRALEEARALTTDKCPECGGPVPYFDIQHRFQGDGREWREPGCGGECDDCEQSVDESGRGMASPNPGGLSRVVRILGSGSRAVWTEVLIAYARQNGDEERACELEAGLERGEHAEFPPVTP